jgi:hypothetical protein
MNILSIERFTPDEGEPVILTLKDKNHIVAFYSNGAFYTLKLDPSLGILRKEFVEAKVWSHIEELFE